MSIDNTTPAFPTTEAHGLNSGMPGTTLRDYFAAKCCAAMVSTISSDYDVMRLREISKELGLDGISEFFARESYKQADAMMKAREVV